MANINDFGKVFFSPPVIIAGVVVGVAILLFNKGSGSPASSGTNTQNNPIALATINAATQQNIAAMGNQVSLAQVAANSGAAMYQQDTVRQAQVLSYLTNINNNNTAISMGINQSQAGITQASIASSTALALDIANNNERLNEAYISANVATGAQQAAVAQATIAANAQTKIARTQAIGQAFGTVGNIVSKAI